MKTLVIIPTYNERENIEDLIAKISAQNQEFHVLVIDDSSPDGTGGIVRELGRENRRIQLISRPSKQGLGTAYLEGFRFALRWRLGRSKLSRLEIYKAIWTLLRLAMRRHFSRISRG